MPVPPKDENEFDISDGAYKCKENTYIFIGEEYIRCYTKQACPGYVNSFSRCTTWENCDDYRYEAPDGN